MIRFDSDYTGGAVSEVLAALTATNEEHTIGYGEDPFTGEAEELIRKLCGQPLAAVHFLPGGTISNLTVIASALRPYQGVVCAQTGHIQVHETGAVEATGHKVLPLPEVCGKISAEQVRELCIAHREDSAREHTVQPGMVYISDTTELGTVYRREELQSLRRVCDEFHLFLFLDGARLSYALAAQDNDLSLPEIAKCCDAFTIGGTKCGALFGEAVVLCNPLLQRDFRYEIKQRGAMFAKGRLISIQFIALLQDGLYGRLAEQANQYALQIRAAFEEKGIPVRGTSKTNQQFFVLNDKQQEELGRDFAFSRQDRLDGGNVVRFCVGSMTKQEDVRQLIDAASRL